MMKYEMLWIDDSPAWVDPMKESIAEYLDELGLNLEVALFPDWRGATTYLDGHDPDPIAVDYNLSELKGDEVVEHIRDKNKFTEILFYTAEEDYTNVLRAQDGVYRTPRAGFDDKVRKLIGLTLKRVQLPAIMRGLVIAETTDLEATIEDVLVQHFGEKGALFRERVLRVPFLYTFKTKYDLLAGLLGDQIKSCNVALNGGGTKDPAVQVRLDQLKKYKAILDVFNAEVVEVRNTLAHVKEDTDAQGRVTLKSIRKDGATIVIDHEWCVKIRKDLAKHGANLAGIHAHGCR